MLIYFRMNMCMIILSMGYKILCNQLCFSYIYRIYSGGGSERVVLFGEFNG